MKRIALIILISSIILILTSCWNMREVNDLGVAVAIGVDVAEDDMLEITVQVLIPRLLAQEGYEGNAVVTYSTTGRTVFEVLRKLSTISSRKIYIGHIQLIVLGEELSRRGIMETIDFFERDHEFRRQTHILVAKDITARDVLETGSLIELIPATHITGAIDNSVYTGITKKVTLIQLFKDLNSNGNQVILPTVLYRFDTKPKVGKDFRIAGTAVFNKDKLIGFLDEYETRGYLWTTEEISSTILVIPDENHEDNLISLEVLNANGKMKVKQEDNKLVLAISVRVESNIGEQQNTIDLTTPNKLDYIKKASEKKIRMEIEEALLIAQEKFKTDFFGFGEIVAKDYPHIWKEVQDNWDDVFCCLPVEIEVTSNIRRSGQIFQPSRPK